MLKQNWLIIAVILFFVLRKKEDKEEKPQQQNEPVRNVESSENETKEPISENVLQQDFDEINSIPKTDFGSC